MPWGKKSCDKIRDLEEARAKMIEANDIVFAIHMPMHEKEMSPWFQFILVMLQFDIAFKMSNQISESAGFNPPQLERAERKQCRVDFTRLPLTSRISF